MILIFINHGSPKVCKLEPNRVDKRQTYVLKWNRNRAILENAVSSSTNNKPLSTELMTGNCKLTTAFTAAAVAFCTAVASAEHFAAFVSFQRQ